MYAASSSALADRSSDPSDSSHVPFCGWDIVLARAELFGFTIGDHRADFVHVERDGRTSSLRVAGEIQVGATDPRDVWLLQQAINGHELSDHCATYFIYRPNDGELVPIQVRLLSDPPSIVFEHDMLDGRIERATVETFETLDDHLPFLAAPNSIGYHRAREAMIGLYQRIRRLSWSEAGIADAEAIAEYEAHHVRPEDVERAAESGIVGMKRDHLRVRDALRRRVDGSPS